LQACAVRAIFQNRYELAVFSEQVILLFMIGIWVVLPDKGTADGDHASLNLPVPTCFASIVAGCSLWNAAFLVEVWVVCRFPQV